MRTKDATNAAGHWLAGLPGLVCEYQSLLNVVVRQVPCDPSLFSGHPLSLLSSDNFFETLQAIPSLGRADDACQRSQFVSVARLLSNITITAYFNLSQCSNQDKIEDIHNLTCSGKRPSVDARTSVIVGLLKRSNPCVHE